jgi:type IV secretory pathway VirB10-like protein
MENQPSEDQVGKFIPAAAFELPVTQLNLPLNTISLLGSGGLATVGELMQRLNLDRESLLTVNGIGPKTLASIELALSEFDLANKTPTYPEPIPSLGDHYKVAPKADEAAGPAIEEVIEKEQKEEKAADEKKTKKKKKKKKKKDKKMAEMKNKNKNPDNTKKGKDGKDGKKGKKKDKKKTKN